jgi:hypothetical protein
MPVRLIKQMKNGGIVVSNAEIRKYLGGKKRRKGRKVGSPAPRKRNTTQN